MPAARVRRLTRQSRPSDSDGDSPGLSLKAATGSPRSAQTGHGPAWARPSLDAGRAAVLNGALVKAVGGLWVRDHWQARTLQPASAHSLPVGVSDLKLDPERGFCQAWLHSIIALSAPQTLQHPSALKCALDSDSSDASRSSLRLGRCRWTGLVTIAAFVPRFMVCGLCGLYA